MDRKDFFKKASGVGIGSCIGFGLLSKSEFLLAANRIQEPNKTPIAKIDARQVQNLLSYVEDNMDEPVKRSVFERLGHEHTTSDGFKAYINGYKDNLKGFFDKVNSNNDTYWESMEYDEKRSAITIIGKPVDRCACPFAQNDNPPKSLCHHCCRKFQVSMFEMMLDRPVKVQIDEAFLLGDKRCSTTIFFEGKLQSEKS